MNFLEMKRLGNHWLAIVLPACVIIAFVFAFVGTPWGYLRFYYATLVHNEAFFSSSATIATLGYAFDGPGYYAECFLKAQPENRYYVKVNDQDGTCVNNYFSILWMSELSQHFCLNYSEFDFSFDIPFLYSKFPIFDNISSIPSVFTYRYADEYINDVQITVPAAMDLCEKGNLKRLYSVATEITELFPNTHITIKYSEKWIVIGVTNQTFMDSFDSFCQHIEKYITPKHVPFS